jgi:hypothetical protein
MVGLAGLPSSLTLLTPFQLAALRAGKIAAVSDGFPNSNPPRKGSLASAKHQIPPPATRRRDLMVGV